MLRVNRGRFWQTSGWMLGLMIVAVVVILQLPAVRLKWLRQPAQLHQQAVTVLQIKTEQPLLFSSGSYVTKEDRLQATEEPLPYAGWIFYRQNLQPELVSLVRESAQHYYQYLVPNQDLWCLGERVLVMHNAVQAEAKLRSLVKLPGAKRLSLGLEFIDVYQANLLNPLAESNIYLIPLQRNLANLWLLPSC